MWICAALTAALVTAGEPGRTDRQGFVEALLADGPIAGRADRMTLYDGLLGSWDLDVVDYAADGSRLESRGEWHFAWVLEGRAIQDVLIIPVRGAAPGAPKSSRFGTTLRVYDPVSDTWGMTWNNPVQGVTTALTARRDGTRIVQQGRDEDGLNRWTFFDVTEQSFRWRGETSSDDGKTWRLLAEFSARRQKPR
jgi:hypothetical protein